MGAKLVVLKKFPTFGLWAFFFLFLLFVSFFFLWWSITRPFYPRLRACDVGQGDAIILRYGSFSLLSDSGPNSAVLRCLQAELPTPFLSAAVLTHWDKDHVGGYSGVMKKFSITHLFAYPKSLDTELTRETEKSFHQIARRSEPVAGDSLVFPGFRLRFLWSPVEQRMLSKSNKIELSENDGSLGFLGAGEGFGFLSLGDLGCQGELAVVSFRLLISTPILKVSHHGSKTSTCPGFIAILRPEVAIVSSGHSNQYGHPHASSLETLRQFGVFVLRTDQRGDIVLQPEQGRLQMEAQKL